MSQYCVHASSSWNQAVYRFEASTRTPIAGFSPASRLAIATPDAIDNIRDPPRTARACYHTGLYRTLRRLSSNADRSQQPSGGLADQLINRGVRSSQGRSARHVSVHSFLPGRQHSGGSGHDLESSAHELMGRPPLVRAAGDQNDPVDAVRKQELRRELRILK